MFTPRALANLTNIAVIDAFFPELPDMLRDMPGYTGMKQRAFLRRLCRTGGIRYLEVGVFQGASLLSAAWGNDTGCFVGIDNFAEGSREQLEQNLDLYYKHHGACVRGSVHVVNADVHILPVVNDVRKVAGSAPFDVLFYDANTSSRAMKTAFENGLDKLMGDCFLWIVDNWSDPVARHNYQHLLESRNWSTFAQWQLMPEHDCDIEGWWSGWLVAVVQKQRLPSTPWYELQGKGPKLWDITRRRAQGLKTIVDYRKQNL